MPYQKGQSGNPGGAWAAKPFRDALRMELAAAGTDSKALREVAQVLVDKAKEGDLAAIVAIADRLDGRPAQSSTVAFAEKRDLTDWTNEELLAVLNEGRAMRQISAVADESDEEPETPH